MKMKRMKKGYKNSLQVVFSFLTVFIFSGCEKVINVDLNEAAPQIVIEGLITDRPGPYTVLISKSGSYFNQPVLPPVTGAEVTITDSRGIVDSLKETQPGIYLTSKTRGIPGTTYTLNVISENVVYTASSTMPSHVDIIMLELEKSQSAGLGFGGIGRENTNIDINCIFQDPPEKNFYRLKITTNDTTEAQNYHLYDDQYTNNQEIDLRAGRAVAGDNDLIELYSLDSQTYEYYRTLEDLLHINPIFGSTPANPNTNLTNGALGYFGASAVSSKTIIITDALLNALK